MTSTQSQKSKSSERTSQKPAQKQAQKQALPTGRFCWLALRTPDVEKSCAFYGHVVGWRFDKGSPQMPMPTFAGSNGPVAHVEVIKGAARFASYVVVDDLGAAVKRAVAAGGRVVGDVVAMPGTGSMREVSDGDGATFSLFQPESEARAQGSTGDGAFVWNELHAKNDDAAVAFLTAVVGYVVEQMPMAGQRYSVLKSASSHEMLAGVMKGMDPTAPSSWVPYLQVADVDTALARAAEKGASVVLGATAVDGVGRFAIIVDPQGAVVGLLTPAPRA